MSDNNNFYEYPKWKYHRELSPTIVNNKKEENELGSGWENSPAYFEKNEAESEETEAGQTKRKRK